MASVKRHCEHLSRRTPKSGSSGCILLACGYKLLLHTSLLQAVTMNHNDTMLPSLLLGAKRGMHSKRTETQGLLPTLMH